MIRSNAGLVNTQGVSSLTLKSLGCMPKQIKAQNNAVYLQEKIGIKSE